MKLDEAIGITRNPYGIDADTVREARLAVCDEVEWLQRELEAAKTEAEAKIEKYREALIKAGCNDMFCAESSRICRVCPAGFPVKGK